MSINPKPFCVTFLIVPSAILSPIPQKKLVNAALPDITLVQTASPRRRMVTGGVVKSIGSDRVCSEFLKDSGASAQRVRKNAADEFARWTDS